MALLERPDGSGVSRTKLTALAAMAYPLIEPYLDGGAFDPEAVRRFAPYILLGLGLYYLRAAIKGNPPNLDKMAESFQGVLARLSHVQRQLEEAQAQAETERALRKEIEEFHNSKPLSPRRGDVRADDLPLQDPE